MKASCRRRLKIEVEFVFCCLLPISIVSFSLLCNCFSEFLLASSCSLESTQQREQKIVNFYKDIGLSIGKGRGVRSRSIWSRRVISSSSSLSSLAYSDIHQTRNRKVTGFLNRQIKIKNSIIDIQSFSSSLLKTKKVSPGKANLILMSTSSTSAHHSSGSSHNDKTDSKKVKLNELSFDNLAIHTLPLDPVKENYIRMNVPNSIYSKVNPTPVKNPQLVAISNDCLSDILDLQESEMVDEKNIAEYFGGNKLLTGSEPYAHCYCGHQFGGFSGQLGDGAAMSLGEIVNSRGERWELQLKGSGPTPYSRRADGRKVLRSSIREFLCSEAMAHLKIPTTRAGTLVTSDTKVQRDIHYNGNVINERATIVSRLAPTFLRFGSFEIFKARDPRTGRTGPSEGNIQLLRQLLHHAIFNYYPDIAKKYSINPIATNTDLTISNEVNDASTSVITGYGEFFKEVVCRTARMVAKWQSVGWTHGVLNTDNMSILGITIDYGPYGFMEHYDPDYIPNASDNNGRYTYQAQPEICKWNCMKFAEALAPILPLHESKEMVETLYDKAFETEYYSLFRQKLGLFNIEENEDEKLIKDLFQVMEKTSVEFTSLFRILSSMSLPLIDNEKDDTDIQSEKELLIESVASKIAAICVSPSAKFSQGMKRVQLIRPSMPPHQVQMLYEIGQKEPEKLQEMFSAPLEAILGELEEEMEKMKKTVALVEQMEEIKDMSEEEKRNQDACEWTAFLETYIERIYRDNLGKNTKDMDESRRKRMKEINPSFILRNWILQEAISAAEKLDFSVVRNLLRKVQTPFESTYSGPSMSTMTDSTISTSQQPSASSSTSSISSINSQAQYDGEILVTPDWALKLTNT